MNPYVEKWQEEDREGRITMIAWAVVLIPAVLAGLVGVTALMLWGGLGLLNDYFDALPDNLKYGDAYKIALGVTMITIPFRRRNRLKSSPQIMVAMPGFESLDMDDEDEVSSPNEPFPPPLPDLPDQTEGIS